MGTQQVLYITLGIIIVGTAVAIAILNFGGNADQANKDALTQDCLHLASAAQGYFNKPEMLGGGDGTFEGISIDDCGMQGNSNGEGQNLDGTFSIVKAENQRLIIRAASRGNSAQIVTLRLEMDYKRTKEEKIEIRYEGW